MIPNINQQIPPPPPPQMEFGPTNDYNNLYNDLGPESIPMKQNDPRAMGMQQMNQPDQFNL